MAVDLSNTLIVAISATALFDLDESERYREQLIEQDPLTAAQRFREYMQERENDSLEIGAGFPLIQALLNLNNCGQQAEEGYQNKAPLGKWLLFQKAALKRGYEY